MNRARRSAWPFTDAQRASGDWNPLWTTFSEWDPEFLEAYLRLRSVPFRNGPLPKKVKELILIAINAATTHLYAPGVRRHIRNALRHGATREEIMEAIELTTVLGIHSSNLAVPILAEELAAESKKRRVTPGLERYRCLRMILSSAGGGGNERDYAGNCRAGRCDPF